MARAEAPAVTRQEVLSEAIKALREEMRHYGPGARAGLEAAVDVLTKMMRTDTEPCPPPESHR